ncbi:hypothetical protein ONZ43_g12 [Nemania bipapillata]|uniref:Uncharacterized protein n=1 Tax=Nemania bipapillata TaxID=110536 RepID=A0ACC2J9N7_9PEZI|nr:hypothetical protein ONZ43_g12 [Nemania bipapillata]
MSLDQFILTRASTDDIPEITRLEYTCFEPIVRELFMGCKSEADIPRMAEKHIRDMAADPFEVWFKILDSATGKIVAASNWKFFVNGPAPRSSDEHPPEWLEGETQQQAAQMMSAMNDSRRKGNPGAHVRK